jgi:hypothetical protein
LPKIFHKFIKKITRVKKVVFYFVILPYNFEAIHNKDYSVVKTFKAAIGKLIVAFFIKIKKIPL